MMWRPAQRVASTIVCLLVWMLVAAAAPPASASEANEELTVARPSVSGQHGQRISGGDDGQAPRRGFSPTGAVAEVLGFAAFAEDEPSAEEEEGPEATELESEAYSKAKKQATEWAKSFQPHFIVYPEYTAQVVWLESFLHITDPGWVQKSFTKTEDDVTVTVTAKPIESTWKFTERSTGDVVTIVCAGRGEPYTDGDTDAECGRTFEHTSAVTGPVDLSVRIRFTLSTASSLSEDESGLDEAPATLPSVRSAEFTQVLHVGEVQAYGANNDSVSKQSEPREPYSVGPEEVDCGWLLDGLLAIAGISCETAHDVYNMLKDGAAACAGGIITSIKDTVEALKGLAKDPVGTIKDAISGITELIRMAKEEPAEFAQVVAENWLGITLEEWETLGKTERVNKAIEIICAKAFEYITGKGLEKLLSVVKKVKTNKKDKGGNDDGQKKKDDADGAGCKIASFATGTPVLMADQSYLPIERIRPGDYVMSHNFDTSVWEPRLVLDQWSHVDRGPPTTLTLADGSQAVATADHLFWVETSLEWTELQHVGSGDVFLTPTGTATASEVSLDEAQPWIVWELTIEHNHNFAISTGTEDVLDHNQAGFDAFTVHTGTTDLLVHNADCLPGTRKRLLDDFDIDTDKITGEGGRLDELVKDLDSGDTRRIRSAQAELNAIKRAQADGKTVELRPGNGPDGQRNPDFRIDGKLTDTKSVTNTNRGIRDAVDDVNNQIKKSEFPNETGEAVIELATDPADFGKLDSQVRRSFNPNRGRNLDTVTIVDKAGNILGRWGRRADGTVEHLIGG